MPCNVHEKHQVWDFHLLFVTNHTLHVLHMLSSDYTTQSALCSKASIQMPPIFTVQHNVFCHCKCLARFSRAFTTKKKKRKIMPSESSHNIKLTKFSSIDTAHNCTVVALANFICCGVDSFTNSYRRSTKIYFLVLNVPIAEPVYRLRKRFYWQLICTLTTRASHNLIVVN